MAQPPRGSIGTAAGPVRLPDPKNPSIYNLHGAPKPARLGKETSPYPQPDKAPGGTANTFTRLSRTLNTGKKP